MNNNIISNKWAFSGLLKGSKWAQNGLIIINIKIKAAKMDFLGARNGLYLNKWAFFGLLKGFKWVNYD